MKRLRIGFIGAGWWATTNHIPILSQRQDVELAGVCGLGKEMLQKVKSRFDFPLATEDYRELLAEKLDGVVVASPHHLHYEHARAALLAGCHVMVEKPMTLRANEAWALVNLAKERNLQIVVPYGWHYKSFVQRAKQLMEEETLVRLSMSSVILLHPPRAFLLGADYPLLNGRPPSPSRIPRRGKSKHKAVATLTARFPTPRA